MEQYFVVVNQKYIVKVKANSACGAERVVLDEFNGIRGAQAFGVNEIATDCFAHFMKTCDTISMKELRTMSDAYDARCTALSKAMDRVRALKDHIVDAEKALEIMKAELAASEAECRDYEPLVHEI